MEIKRSTVIGLVAFLVVCFLVNVVTFYALLNSSRSSLRNEISALKSTLDQRTGDVDTNRPEATFIFEIKDAENFLNSGKKRASQFFFCRSMRFYLGLQKIYADGEYYLAVYLYRFNPSDPFAYSIETDFELTLLNRASSLNKVLEIVHTFKSSSSYDGRGEAKFISISELTGFGNGWIEDDTIKMQVHLRCEDFKRFN